MNWRSKPPKQTNPIKVAQAASSSRSDTFLVPGMVGRRYSAIPTEKLGPGQLTFGKLALLISARSNVDRALNSILVFQQKQIPFAAALGLTNIANKIMQV